MRSRMKKREEVEILEAEVRALNEAKAATDSENSALKRQLDYFQKLFENQQLNQNPVPTPQVNPAL